MNALAAPCTQPLTAALPDPAPVQPALTLVSRRWQEVFYNEPTVWRFFVLDFESLDEAEAEGQAWKWFAAKARLLRCVGHFVQHLDYRQVYSIDGEEAVVDVRRLAAESGVVWRLSSSVLAHLSPASLHTLHLDVTEDAVQTTDLRHLSSIVGLTVLCHGAVPSCIVAALPSLPKLQHLVLLGRILPAGLAEALPRLTGLTSLTCFSRGSLPMLSAIYPLTQLRKLTWEDERQDGLLQVQVQQLLAQLPHMEAWDLFSTLSEAEGANLQVRLAGHRSLQSLAALDCCA